MTIDEIINKNVLEMIKLTGHFEDSEVYRIYIQRALVIGMEYGNEGEQIIAFDKTGQIFGRYRNQAEAEKKTGIHRPNICEVISGKRHSAGGLIFAKDKDWKL